jgi:hypothetical protein
MNEHTDPKNQAHSNSSIITQTHTHTSTYPILCGPQGPIECRLIPGNDGHDHEKYCSDCHGPVHTRVTGTLLQHGHVDAGLIVVTIAIIIFRSGSVRHTLVVPRVIHHGAGSGNVREQRGMFVVGRRDNFGTDHILQIERQHGGDGQQQDAAFTARRAECRRAATGIAERSRYTHAAITDPHGEGRTNGGALFICRL